MLSDYLLAHHKEDLIAILQDEDDSKHFSINIKLDRLLQEDSSIANKLLREFDSLTTECKQSAVLVQHNILEELEDNNLIVKNNVHIRLYNFPPCPELVKVTLPRNQDVGSFLEISGTIIRTTIPKLLEFRRNYECTKCKQFVTVNADFEQKYLIQPPNRCPNSECNGNRFSVASGIDRTNSKDYQEIKLQEQILQSTVGLIPHSLWVILEDDLVDSCKPGDRVAICGIVKSRWKIPAPGKIIEVEIVIKANHVFVNNDSSAITVVTPEIKEYFSLFWKKHQGDPLKGRDTIVKSFCPDVYGLFIVKLALMVTLAGGSQFKDVNDTKIKTRSQPHLLLVGDPGTGKSQLLKFAAKVISRSVFTTGIGSTSAGLTVTAVNENGEWQLEAGALVLSDGGICCIDEFNSMKEHDRTSIHEAMEQQTLSIAKASIVCKLNTRCSILAATNPKGMLDSTQNFNTNIGMASPLLSRFDLVFILKDSINSDWDNTVANFILNDYVDDDKQNAIWDLQILQAYMICIKKIHPTLTDDTNKILAAYYQFQRRSLSRNRARTTVRLLDSLVRLSQGHARLMYHTEVKLIDAITAVILVEASMQGESNMFGLEFDVYSCCMESPSNFYIQMARTVLNKLELFDLLEKELQNIEDRKNWLETSKEGDKLEETVLQNSFKNLFRRCNSTAKTIIISKRKSSDDASNNVKKRKLDQPSDSENENTIFSDYKSQDQIIDNALGSSYEEDKVDPKTSGSNATIFSETDVSHMPKFHFKSKFEDNFDDVESSFFFEQDNLKGTSENSDSEKKMNDANVHKTDTKLDEKDEIRTNTSINSISNLAPKDITENKLDNKRLSQKTRKRTFLDKFRFVPRDQNLPNENVSSEQIQEKSNKNSEKEECGNMEIRSDDNELPNNEIQNTPSEDISQNTKNRRFMNSFCWKPRRQVSEVIQPQPENLCTQSKMYSQSIFEEEEDCENLDLDL